MPVSLKAAGGGEMEVEEDWKKDAEGGGKHQELRVEWFCIWNISPFLPPF